MSGLPDFIAMEFIHNLLTFMVFFIFSFYVVLGYQGLCTETAVVMNKMGHLQMKNLALSEVTDEMEMLNNFVSVIKAKSLDGLERTCAACSTDDDFSPGNIGPFFMKQVYVATGQFSDQPGGCPGAKFLPAPKNVEEMAQLAEIMKNNSIFYEPVNNFVLDKMVCIC